MPWVLSIAPTWLLTFSRPMCIATPKARSWSFSCLFQVSRTASSEILSGRLQLTKHCESPRLGTIIVVFSESFDSRPVQNLSSTFVLPANQSDAGILNLLDNFLPARQSWDSWKRATKHNHVIEVEIASHRWATVGTAWPPGVRIDVRKQQYLCRNTSIA